MAFAEYDGASVRWQLGGAAVSVKRDKKVSFAKYINPTAKKLL